MPGGFYRTWLKNDLDKDKERLVAAIDTYLESTGFDIVRYRRISQIASVSVGRMIDALQGGNEPRVEHYTHRGEKFQELRYEMYRPVFDEMVEQGFPRDLLVR